MKRFFLAVICLLTVNFAQAASDKSFSFNFQKAEMDVILAAYSKATGQKFVVDPGVRGKIDIINPDKVSAEEAFHLLSTGLAINGFAILQEGDLMVVRSARNAQRSLTEVTSTLPALRPERMVTWIYQFKNIKTEGVNRDLRILTSKDGELSIEPSSNSVIISDWISNLHRVVKIFETIDVAKVK